MKKREISIEKFFIKLNIVMYLLEKKVFTKEEMKFVKSIGEDDGIRFNAPRRNGD